MTEYKGYIANIAYDASINALHGTVLGLSDVITFEAESTSEIEQAFHDSVDDYLEYCAELGREPERTFSGKFNLRVPTTLHHEIYVRAQISGKSMNAWIVETIESSIVAAAKVHETAATPDWMEAFSQEDFGTGRSLIKTVDSILGEATGQPETDDLPETGPLISPDTLHPPKSKR